jgi:hypothetical protein
MESKYVPLISGNFKSTSVTTPVTSKPLTSVESVSDESFRRLGALTTDATVIFRLVQIGANWFKSMTFVFTLDFRKLDE